MTSAPVRLLDDDDANEALRMHLAAAADSASGYDVSAGLARFEAGLVVAGTPSEAQTSSVAAGGSTTGSLVLKLLAAVVLVGSGGYMAATARPAAEQREAKRQLPPSIVDKPQVESVPFEPPSSPSAPAESAPRPIANSAQSSVGAPVTPRPTASPAQRSEVTRVLRARELLRSDPNAALRLLRQIERDTPNAVLREEREGLTVLALWELGGADTGRARVLAQRFLTSYPNSALRARMQALLESP